MALICFERKNNNCKVRMVRKTITVTSIGAVFFFCVIQICFSSWFLYRVHSVSQAKEIQVLPPQQSTWQIHHKNGLAMQLVPMINISTDINIPCIVHRMVPSLETVSSLGHKKYQKFYGSWSKHLRPNCHQYIWSNDDKDKLVSGLVPEDRH